MDKFSELSHFLEENESSQNIVKQFIISHLHVLSQWFDKYFPEDTTPPLDIITLHSIKYPPSNGHRLIWWGGDAISICNEPNASHDHIA